MKTSIVLSVLLTSSCAALGLTDPEVSPADVRSASEKREIICEFVAQLPGAQFDRARQACAAGEELQAIAAAYALCVEAPEGSQ